MAYNHVQVKYTIGNYDSNYLSKFIISPAFEQFVEIRGLAIIKEALKPLRRTGSLEDSWKIEKIPTGIRFYSEDEAASSIQLGWSQPAPKDELLAWMQNKSEFQNLDDKEQSRAAFAIRRSMQMDLALGKTSTIKNLAPVGDRRFNYFLEVGKNISKEIKDYFR